jgi:hypothetical protein
MAARGVAEMTLRTSIEEDGEARLQQESRPPAARNSGRWLVGVTALSGGAEERERESEGCK